jgi:probable F420-dependent oxidoreductase
MTAGRRPPAPECGTTRPVTFALGVLMFPTDQAIRPDELAREAEARGFESLWFPEHTHIPVSRLSPWPGGPELPEEYKRTHDPFVALTAAGAATERLKLATGICLVAQRDPIALAKQIASLDMLSGGRFLFGIGVGWNVEEMENHGVDPATRRALVREKVLAMKSLWTEDEGGFDGDLVHVSRSWSWPKPAQQPHPPVIMGGTGGPVTFRHVAEYCDGWMPIHGRRDVLDKLPLLRKTCEEAGRDPDSIELGVFGVPPSEEVIASYRDAGVRRCVLALPAAPRDVVLPWLDRSAELLASCT